MNFLDMRTVIFSHVIIDVVCALVMAFLWLQNRKRFAGTAWWVLDFALQAVATVLIVLRGSIPDWISMVVANTLVMAGALCGYLGLERFVGSVRSQVHNYALLVIFAGVHTYFSVGQPNLTARNFNLSLGLLLLCGQCTWLMFQRVPPDLRPLTRGVGLVFGGYCLVSLVRVVEFFTSPHPENDFFQSSAFETLTLLAYQLLLILLTYSLALMVNGRLITEIRTQEEKFTRAFHSSPYAITLTRLSDGKIFEVNDSFVKLSGYQANEVLGKTTPELHLWANEDDRRQVISILSQQQSIHGQECLFRKKTGDLLTGLFSAELLTINNQPCVLSSINDISERKRAEATILALAKFPDENPNPVLRITRDGLVRYANQGSADLLQVWRCAVGQQLPDRWPQIIAATLESGVDREEEAVCGPRVFALALTPIIDGGYVNIYGSDITVRKQAEEEVRESQERFRTMADFTYDWEYWVGPDHQYVYISPACERITGYCVAEFRDDPDLLVNITDPADRQAISDHISQEFQTTEIASLDFRITTRAGEPRWINHFCQSVYGADGRWLGRRATNRDITDRKQAEEALQFSEARYRRLFEAAQDGILILDADTGQVIDANPFMQDLLGYSGAELVGKRLWDIGPFKDIVASKIAFGELQRQGYIRYEDLPVETNDGRRINVEFVSNVYLVNNKPVIQCNIRDITARKQAEERLRKSEKKLREAQAMAHLGFWYWDVQTGSVEWSEEVFTIFGLDPQAFTPHIDSILALSPWPEDHQRDQELIKRAIENHGPGSYEQKFLRPDQSIGYYVSTFQGNYAENGQLLSIVGTVLDITARKRAEEDLRNLLLRYETLLAAVPEMIMEVNHHKVYTWANQAGLEFFGADMLGKAAADFFEGSQETYATVQPIFDGSEQTIYVESWQRRKDGEKRLLAWWCRALKDGSGNVIGAISSARDITERKQAEEALRASEDKFKYVFDHSMIGKSITLPSGEISVNQAFCDMLGYTPDELRRQRWQDLTHPDDIEPTQHAIDPLLAGEKDSLRFIKRYLHKNGSVVWADVSTTLRRDQDEKPLYFMTTVSDITARKRAEAERERLNVELVQKNKELEQLVYVTSHDLRSPLVNVQGFSKELSHAMRDLTALLQSADVPEHIREKAADIMATDIQEDVYYILTSIAKMDALLTGLLRLSRLGRAALTITTLDMSTLMANALTTFQFRIQQAGVTVEVAELPACQGDAIQISQVFANLLDNALKYLDSTRPGIIKITGDSKDDHAIYCIADNGIGIAPEHHAKIFEVFQRLNPTAGTGEGLGLAVVRKILERQGGKIWVESEPGRGSAFYVSLPH